MAKIRYKVNATSISQKEKLEKVEIILLLKRQLATKNDVFSLCILQAIKEQQPISEIINTIRDQAEDPESLAGVTSIVGKFIIDKILQLSTA